MRMQKKPQMVEAVVFFNDRGICKEMLYPEFEALLDNIVQMPEYADQQMSLAYLLINPRLMVRAVVLFYLDFDETGQADPGWNLPLRQLADRAGRGPDMGAGPIRLACASQCPVPWHQMHLWDPSLVSGNNHLVMIREAVKRNHLGLLVDEEPVVVEPERLQMAAEHQWYAPVEEPRGEAEKIAREMLQEHQQKSAEMLTQHEMRIAALNQQHERELSKHRLGAEEQLKALRRELTAVRECLQREEQASTSLRQELAACRLQRDELVERLSAVEQEGQVEIAVLRTNLQVEAQAKVAGLLAQCKEQLAIRDAELSYRTELERHLRLENEALRAEHSASKDSDEVEVLGQLSGLGVIFVAYHPGAGRLTIPLQELARYRQNPMAYAASKCLVSESRYRDWLAHYQQPTCDGRMSNGERCAIPVDRVDTPSRFVEGDNNCCSRHKGRGLQPGLN
ncbi:hypothetical protein D3C81_857080 [compost metagenome]